MYIYILKLSINNAPSWVKIAYIIKRDFKKFQLNANKLTISQIFCWIKLD